MTARLRIVNAFTQARLENRALLMPFITLGYPDRSRSLELIQAIAASGADILELGMPFSDPLADGPVIQAASQVALAAGITVGGCLDLVRQLRARQVAQPLLLMGYYNPLLAYGIEAFVSQAAEAGVAGLIVADLPPDESAPLADCANRAGLALIHLLAPNSPPARRALVIDHSSEFIYLVSVTGVTGVRQHLTRELPDLIAALRQETDLPLAVGFGISTPAQAAEVARGADGVIVGSALLNLISASLVAGADPLPLVRQFIHTLRQSVSRRTPAHENLALPSQ